MFPVFSSDGYFVRWTVKQKAFEKCEFILNFGLWFRRCCLIFLFLFLSLTAILFTAAEDRLGSFPNGEKIFQFLPLAAEWNHSSSFSRALCVR